MKCIVPWLWLHMEPSGKVIPCCSNPKILGDIKTQSLEEIWNGEEMKKFRLSLLEELPESCFSCKKSEELGSISLRKTYNQIFKDSFNESIDNTNNDGSLKVTKFKGYHFRISSKCNFKCRMCDEETSSAFNGKIVEHTKDLNFEEFVENNIQDFEAIGFAGGETLIMDEHYWFLQKLIDNGKTNIDIQYSTNASILKYKSHDVLDYWKKFNPEKLSIAASIDEIGKRAEYIRKGTVWSVVDKNLKILTTQPFNRQITTVVSCYNVFRLPEIIQYLTDIGYIKPEKFLEGDQQHLQLWFMDNGVEESYRACWILPNKFKEKIKLKLNSFIDRYNSEYNTDIGFLFNPIITYLNKETNKRVVQQFLWENVYLDKSNGENLFKTFPEFLEILDEWRLDNLLST